MANNIHNYEEVIDERDYEEEEEEDRCQKRILRSPYDNKKHHEIVYNLIY